MEARYAEYLDFAGYVKLTRAVARKGAPREDGLDDWQVVAGTHPDAAGLKLYQGPTGKTRVVGNVPPGALLELDRPPTQDAPREREFCQVRGGQWIEFTARHVDVQHRMIAKYDQVVTDAVPVRRGEILGYPGAYGPQQRLLHFEIFAEEGVAPERRDAAGSGPDWAGWTILRDPAVIEDQHLCSRESLFAEIDGAGGGAKDGRLSAEELAVAAAAAESTQTAGPSAPGRSRRRPGKFARARTSSRRASSSRRARSRGSSSTVSDPGASRCDRAPARSTPRGPKTVA